jgi:hypothetical protein
VPEALQGVLDMDDWTCRCLSDAPTERSCLLATPNVREMSGTCNGAPSDELCVDCLSPATGENDKG